MTRRLIIALVALVAVAAVVFWAVRHPDGGHPQITVSNAWTAPNPEIGSTAAVYLEIANSGDGADSLMGAETPAADKTELHESRMDGDIMRMERLDSLEVPAGGHADFAPGHRHIMLIGLKQKLAEGGRFPLTLLFVHSGRVVIEVSVKPREAGGMNGGMQH